jgi:chromosome segregation ATPase
MSKRNRNDQNASAEDMLNLNVEDSIPAAGQADPRLANMDSPDAFITRISTVNDDLADIADKVSIRLMQILKSNEELTRETYLTQVETKRASALQKSLSSNLENYRAELQKLQVENAKLEEELKGFRNEAEQKTQKRDAMLREIEILKKETMAGLNVECGKLADERETLSGENDKLRMKKDKLMSEVAALKKIREEYLQQIAKFKELKDELLA